jgi:hypothetical protein
VAAGYPELGIGPVQVRAAVLGGFADVVGAVYATKMGTFCAVRA